MMVSRPDITVVMATYNRCTQLRRTMTHFQRLDTRGLSWELLVVDNGSEDGTADVLAELANGSRLPLTVLTEPAPGKARAVNKALEQAAGELIVFTDDDIVPEADWLRALWSAALRWRGACVFGGRVIPLFPKGAPAWIRDSRKIDHETIFAAYAPAPREGIVSTRPVGPNMAIPRAVLGNQRIREDIGPKGANDYIPGDESELIARLITDGASIVYVPDAVVHHVVRSEQLTLESLWRRAAAFGRASAMVLAERQPRPIIGGVALKYWWAALRAAIRYAALRFASEERRFTSGWKWHFRRSRVRQHRRQALGRQAQRYRHSA